MKQRALYRLVPWHEGEEQYLAVFWSKTGINNLQFIGHMPDTVQARQLILSTTIDLGCHYRIEPGRWEWTLRS